MGLDVDLSEPDVVLEPGVAPTDSATAQGLKTLKASTFQSTGIDVDLSADVETSDIDVVSQAVTSSAKRRKPTSRKRHTTSQTKRTVGKPRKQAAAGSKVDVETVPEAVASGMDDLDIPTPSKPQRLPFRLWTKVVNAVKDAISNPGWFAKKWRG